MVEQEGIRRAYAEMRKADRLLVMVDSRDGELNPQDIHSLLPQSQQQLENLDLPVTVVLNKADLSGMATGPLDSDCFVISATTGDGLPDLRDPPAAATSLLWSKPWPPWTKGSSNCTAMPPANCWPKTCAPLKKLWKKLPVPLLPMICWGVSFPPSVLVNKKEP